MCCRRGCPECDTRWCCRPSVLIEDKAVDTLAHLSDGDARAGLNGL